jgi:multicomponent K+:H+ antiporter subunit E
MRALTWIWRKLLPTPIISLALLAAWLMLNQSASAGQALLGAALALVIPWLCAPYREHQPRLRAFGTVMRLTVTVAFDVVRSNIEVARRVLGPEAAIEPRFVWVPLDLRDPHAQVLLAGIVTTTPGTISSDLSADRRHLLVHALHCPDEASAAALVAEIKSRYETPLRAVFE